MNNAVYMRLPFKQEKSYQHDFDQTQLTNQIYCHQEILYYDKNIKKRRVLKKI